MGYAKSKAQEQIHIHMKFRVINKDNGTDESCDVTHIMRAPTVGEREEYHRNLAKMKGRKIQSNVNQANWILWKKCIIGVLGYDDLPQNGDWHAYFEDGIERFHADEASQRLIESLESEETEVEKKFVPSSAQ